MPVRDEKSAKISRFDSTTIDVMQIDHTEWNRLRKVSGLTMEQFRTELKKSYKYAPSLDQLWKIFGGRSGTSKPVVEATAKIFDVDVRVLVGHGGLSKRYPGWKFNSRKWLRQDHLPLSGPDKAPFQNFEESTKSRTPIAGLWTELWRDWICASPEPGEKRDLTEVLKVEYCNSGKKTCPNISIHPQHQVPRKRLPNQSWLCLQAKYEKYKSKNLPVLGLRVGDAHHYQWEYGTRGYRTFSQLSGAYSTFYFGLDESDSWKLMTPDSKSPARPDFRLLTTIVLETGFGSLNNIDSAGEATILIKNISLCSNETFVPKLKNREKRQDFQLTADEH